jgi:hypothetical protein
MFFGDDSCIEFLSEDDALVVAVDGSSWCFANPSLFCAKSSVLLLDLLARLDVVCTEPGLAKVGAGDLEVTLLLRGIEALKGLSIKKSRVVYWSIDLALIGADLDAGLADCTNVEARLAVLLWDDDEGPSLLLHLLSRLDVGIERLERLEGVLVSFELGHVTGGVCGLALLADTGIILSKPLSKKSFEKPKRSKDLLLIIDLEPGTALADMGTILVT